MANLKLYFCNDIVNLMWILYFNSCFDISGDTFNKEKADVKSFAIGPEGGWTNEELSNFQNKYKISDFSLRTETAAISAVSLVM